MNNTFSATCLLLLASIAAWGAKHDEVTIQYDGNNVVVDNNVKGVKISHIGGNVVIDNTLTDQEVRFVLSGTSDRGSFTYRGSHKSTISLKGLTLKSAEGPALNFKCGKRMKLNIVDNTVNTIEDSADTLHKACIATKGHLEVCGKGTLTITANSTNAIKAKEQIEFKDFDGVVNIKSATGNGINSGKHLTVIGGKMNFDLSSIDKKALTSDSLMTLKDCNIQITMTGDGGKGIKSNDDLIIDNAILNIKTSGNYVSEGNGWGGFGGFGGPMEGDEDGEGGWFGGPMGGFPGFGGPDGPGGMGGFPGFGGEMNDSAFQKMIEEGRKQFEEMMANGEMPEGFGGFGGPMGGFPGFGEGEDGEGFGGPMGGFPNFGGPDGPGGMGGFPDFGGPDGPMGGMGGFPGFGGPMGGFGGAGGGIQISDSIRNLLFSNNGNGDEDDMRGWGGKRHYEGTAKGIKVMGRITLENSFVHIETSTGGAEGMEAKKGMELKSGKIYVKAHDDAINSNGKIVFSGADVFAYSTNNDAIDSNSRASGAITISDGKVISCSQTGPPEEAFDCDFSPFILTGGTVFGMGGSMMGEATAPTVNEETQPTMILNGLPCPKGKTLLCLDENGKELFSYDIPFTMQSSASILSLPDFQKGKKYTIKIKDPDVVIKEITFDEVIAR